MSLQKKLGRAYRKGLLDGYKDTWMFYEQAMKDTPGIGPKRLEAVQKRVAELAKERFHKEREDGK